MEDRRDDDSLQDPLPPPPEPPPLPEAPLGPPSMADEPAAPPWQPQPQAAQGYPPPAPPPPPPGYGQPGNAPQQPPPGYAPPGQTPQQPPPVYAPPPGQAPPAPGYPPPPPAYPPPYQPPVPAQRGAHGQPVFKGMECASWGRRVGAYLIDGALAATLPFVAGIPLAASDASGLEALGAFLIIGSIFLFFPLYAAAFEARSGAHAGQTLGKQLLGIRVVRDGGERLGFGYALLREGAVRWLLINMIGGLFFFPPFLNLLWPLWDESNRSLHDMIVSTHVVRADAAPGGATLGSTGLPG